MQSIRSPRITLVLDYDESQLKKMNLNECKNKHENYTRHPEDTLFFVVIMRLCVYCIHDLIINIISKLKGCDMNTLESQRQPIKTFWYTSKLISKYLVHVDDAG